MNDKSDMSEIPKNAQINDQNEIALRYHQSGRAFIQRTPTGKEYVAVTQANICLAWIVVEDLANVLARKAGCCGRKKQAFHLASEADVRIWTNKGGR